MIHFQISGYEVTAAACEVISEIPCMVTQQEFDEETLESDVPGCMASVGSSVLSAGCVMNAGSTDS